MEFFFLFLQEFFEWSLELFADNRHLVQVGHDRLDQGLVEGHDDEDLLDVHLDNGFPDQRGAKEGPERNQEVSARDPGQVEQWIGNLSNRIYQFDQD